MAPVAGNWHGQDSRRVVPRDCEADAREGRALVVVLGLDLGTTTGWALYRESALHVDQGGVSDSGVWNLHPPRTGAPGYRYREFNTLVRGKIVKDSVTLVAYEDVKAHAGTLAAHACGGFLAVLEVACGDLGVCALGVGVGSVKKYATGKGNADKELMVLAARRRWPEWKREKYDHNEADARWIAELGAMGVHDE